MAKKNSNVIYWLGGAAVLFFLFKKHQDDLLEPVVSPLPAIDPANPVSVMPPIINTVAPTVYPQTGPATFNCILNEQLTPFIDGNIQLKGNGVIALDVYTQGSNSVQMSPGMVYTIEGYAPMQSALDNPGIRMTITRNGLLIFDKAISANGGSLVKSGIVKPGSVYNALVRTLSNMESFTAVDVDDNTISGVGVESIVYAAPSLVIIDGVVY